MQGLHYPTGASSKMKYLLAVFFEKRRQVGLAVNLLQVSIFATRDILYTLTSLRVKKDADHQQTNLLPDCAVVALKVSA